VTKVMAADNSALPGLHFFFPIYYNRKLLDNRHSSDRHLTDYK